MAAARINNPNPQSATANMGLQKRAAYFAGGSVVPIMGKLLIGPHMTTKYYLPNLEFSYVAVLQPEAFFLMSNEAAGSYRFLVHEASLLVKRIKCTDAVALAHAALLQKQNALYSFRNFVTREKNIPTGDMAFTWDNCIVSKYLPRGIVMMLLPTSAKLGGFTQNPYYMRNAGVSSMTVTLGTRKIPSFAFNTNVAAKSSLLEYWQTMQSLGYISSNTAPGNFTRQTFESAMWLSVIDLTRNNEMMAPYRNGSFEAESLKISGTFSAGLTEPYTLLLIAVMDASVEITSLYQAYPSY